MKIISITKKAVAYRYYQKVAPGRYDEESARKQFDKQCRAKNPVIDKKLVIRVLRELQRKQMEILK